MLPALTAAAGGEAKAPTSISEKDSHEIPANIDACDTANLPLNINPKARPTLR